MGKKAATAVGGGWERGVEELETLGSDINCWPNSGSLISDLKIFLAQPWALCTYIREEQTWLPSYPNKLGSQCKFLLFPGLF